MADAKGRHDWDAVSLIWATLANTARDPKQRPKPFSPSDVHPYRSAEEYRERPMEAPSIEILKALLPHG